jgi:hypothetical protein
MKYIKTFESYLKSGRYLLYHTIRNTKYAKMVMDDDEIKIGGGVSRGPKGICMSRSINWTNQLSNNFRFVLDSDLLIRGGYKPYPLQELIYKCLHSTEVIIPNINVWKGNLDWYKKSKRTTPHGVSNLPDHTKSVMETEFEERILKNIKNAGKYIVYIDFTSYPTGEVLDSLIKYIEKYPHIKARIMDRKSSHIVKEFTPTKVSVDFVKPYSMS